MNKYYKQNRDIDVGSRYTAIQKRTDVFNYTMNNKDYLLKLIMKKLDLTSEDLHLRPSDLKNKIRNNKLNIILED